MNFVFENENGEQLQLLDNSLFYLVNQAGQTQANTNISALTIGDLDGDIVTNVQTQPRTITLTLRINPAVNVEYAKREILKIVKLKQSGMLIWTQNERKLYIRGIVESVDMPRWNKAVAMQISMHCPIPFWADAEETIQQINEAIGLHYFTAHDDYTSPMLFFPEGGIPLGEYDTSRSRTFYNDGDVAVGMEIEILAISNVTNPIIYDDAQGTFFGVGYGTKQVDLQAGDYIRINTNRGQLSVVKNGTTNLMNFIVPRSTWLQLQTGQNTFRISSADQATDNMTFFLSYRRCFV